MMTVPSTFSATLSYTLVPDMRVCLLVLQSKNPKGRKPYVIPMPPPNVTGYLHMGHAMFVALQVAHAPSLAHRSLDAEKREPT